MNSIVEGLAGLVLLPLPARGHHGCSHVAHPSPAPTPPLHPSIQWILIQDEINLGHVIIVETGERDLPTELGSEKKLAKGAKKETGEYV